MSNYTAREVDQGLNRYRWKDELEDEYFGWDSLYQGNTGKILEVEVLGETVTVKTVAKCEEGENSGYGEAIWLVIQVGTQFFKKTGWTSSYDSDSFDGACTEVRPREKTITVYE